MFNPENLHTSVSIQGKLTQGILFRRYFLLIHQIEVSTYTLNENVSCNANVSNISHPFLLFDNYFQNIYHPFTRENDFEIKLEQVVHQTLKTHIRTLVKIDEVHWDYINLVFNLITKNKNKGKVSGTISLNQAEKKYDVSSSIIANLKTLDFEVRAKIKEQKQQKNSVY